MFATLILCLFPMRIQKDLEILIVISIELNSRIQRSIICCNSFKDMDIKSKSSAYITALKHVQLMWHPKPLLFNFSNTSSTKIENNKGDKTPPCRTPAES